MGKLHRGPETAIARRFFLVGFFFVAKCYIALTTYCGERNIDLNVEVPLSLGKDHIEVYVVFSVRDVKETCLTYLAFFVTFFLIK